MQQGGKRKGLKMLRKLIGVCAVMLSTLASVQVVLAHNETMYLTTEEATALKNIINELPEEEYVYGLYDGNLFISKYEGISEEFNTLDLRIHYFDDSGVLKTEYISEFENLVDMKFPVLDADGEEIWSFLLSEKPFMNHYSFSEMNNQTHNITIQNIQQTANKILEDSIQSGLVKSLTAEEMNKLCDYVDFYNNVLVSNKISVSDKPRESFFQVNNHSINFDFYELNNHKNLISDGNPLTVSKVVDYDKVPEIYDNYFKDAYDPISEITLLQPEILEQMLYEFDYEEYMNNVNSSVYANTWYVEHLIANNTIYQFIHTGGGFPNYTNYMNGYEKDGIIYIELNNVINSANYSDYINTDLIKHHMVLMRQNNEKYPYLLLKAGSGVLTEEECQNYVDDYVKSNIVFDSEIYSEFTTVDEFVLYLEQQLALLAGKKPNAKGYEDIDDYLSLLFEYFEEVAVEIVGNNIYIESENYDDVLEYSQTKYDEIVNMLQLNNVEINSSIKEIITPIRVGLANTVDVDTGEFFEVDRVDSYQIRDLPNINFDFDVYSEFLENEQLVEYMENMLLNTPQEINYRGILEIEKYIEYLYSDRQIIELKAKSNVIELSLNDNLNELEENIVFDNQVQDVLKEHDIQLTKKDSNNIIFSVSNINLSKEVGFVMHSDIVEMLQIIDGFRFIIGDANEGIYIKSTDFMKHIENNDSLSFKLLFSGDKVTLTSSEELLGNVYISLGAVDHLSTVLATIDHNEYEENEENTEVEGVEQYEPEMTEYNWGGQYNEDYNTIEFATKFNGTYKMYNYIIDIRDIYELPKTTREQIEFLVSKGFFELDEEDKFGVDELINRYEFIGAIVKMFFAQDVMAVPDFVDITEDNEYYSLVGSAWENNITQGFQDMTFRGGSNVTNADITAFVANTLAEEKGYVYPEDVDGRLQIFSDFSNIEDWTKKDIALALEYNLTENVGAFQPKQNITRTEAAEMLYVMFMNLYETPNQMVERTEKNTVSPVVLSVGVALGFILLLVGLMKIKQEKSSIKDVKWE